VFGDGSVGLSLPHAARTAQTDKDNRETTVRMSTLLAHEKGGTHVVCRR